MKKHLATLIQPLLGATILAAIFGKLHREEKLTGLREAITSCADHAYLLIPALLSFAVCLFVCTLRWQLLLRQTGLNLPFRKVHALYYLGHFFNAFLLGSTGGDVAKAYYVSRQTQHNRAEAIATILIDRLIGLLSLILLCAITSLIWFEELSLWPATRNALRFTAFLVAGGVALLVGALCKPWLDRWAFFIRLTSTTAAGRILDRMYGALHVCIRSKRIAALAVVYSLINHLVFVGGSYCLGRAMELNLSFLDQLKVFPLINLIASAPLTPSGIGTRDAAAIYMLAPFGVAQSHAVALSLLLFGIVMFWSMVGGIVYIVYAARAGKVQPPD